MYRFFCFAFIFSNIWELSRSQCGVPIPHGKIVGGIDSGGYRYPWFALLLLKKNSFLPVPVCAGSLITKFHVLTAAHCFAIGSSKPYKNLFSVALGVYDICSDTESTRQLYNIENVVIHEKYQRRGKFYDIALIKLDKYADFISICLPIPGVPDLTEIAVIIGFGATGENSGFIPCHILEANVTKFSKKDCRSTKLPTEDKTESSVICAGALNGKVDSCYGDSGGPLQTITSDGRYVISGIVSYGYGCGTPEVPGIYTNVGAYLQWINTKISTLGANESADTKIETVTLQMNKKQKESRKRPSGVFFPESEPTRIATSTLKTVFDRRKSLFNNSYFFYNENKYSNSPTGRNTASKVLFPK